jgi:hypothetical protein
MGIGIDQERFDPVGGRVDEALPIGISEEGLAVDELTSSSWITITVASKRATNVRPRRRSHHRARSHVGHECHRRVVADLLTGQRREARRPTVVLEIPRLTDTGLDPGGPGRRGLGVGATQSCPTLRGSAVRHCRTTRSR